MTPGTARESLVTRSLTLCPNGKTLYASLCGGGCGGIAYVGVFDQTSNHAYYQPAFVFQNGVGGGQKNIAEVSSHEAGHNVGLSHDGTATSGYYSGHGSWAPIMGVGYYRAITQWSRGEYAGANQTQDDFAVMRTNGAVPLTDDYPESPPAALGAGLPDRDHLQPHRCRRLLDHAHPADDGHDRRHAGVDQPRPRHRPHSCAAPANDIARRPVLGIDLGRRRHRIGRQHHDHACRPAPTRCGSTASVPAARSTPGTRITPASARTPCHSRPPPADPTFADLAQRPGSRVAAAAIAWIHRPAEMAAGDRCATRGQTPVSAQVSPSAACWCRRSGRPA